MCRNADRQILPYPDLESPAFSMAKRSCIAFCVNTLRYIKVNGMLPRRANFMEQAHSPDIGLASNLLKDPQYTHLAIQLLIRIDLFNHSSVFVHPQLHAPHAFTSTSPCCTCAFSSCLPCTKSVVAAFPAPLSVATAACSK